MGLKSMENITIQSKKEKDYIAIICCALDPFNRVNDLPKSMNCFIERGDGEYFENLSTCFGMFSFELLFNII